MKFILKSNFITWNDYINAERSNRYEANKIKQEIKKYMVYMLAGEKYQGNYPITLTVRPHFQNKRRDLDNFFLKGVLDGIVAAGVIKNDNLKCIDKIILEAVFDEEPGFEIEINESEGNHENKKNIE